MNKLMLYRGKAMACLILMCLFLVQGCKKEILLQKNNNSIISSKVRNITYREFINSINLKATGSLSTVLTGAKEKVMSTETLAGNLSLVMDSVKLLHLGDTLSYVISIRPQTPRATVFQNLTIQVVKEKTTAFLSTYYPSKEWIDRWRAGHAIAFKDNTVFNKINLNDVLLDTKTINTTNFKQENGLKGKIIASISSPFGAPNIISLAPGECEIYDIYTVVPHQCSTGDWPGSCPWEVGGIPEAGGFLPYYSLERTTGVDCAPAGPTIEGGGGGGGGTVPTPPPTYNPCDGGTPPVSVYFERGTRLAVLPPTPCDPIMPEGSDPSISSNAQYLFNILSISDDSRKQYIISHNEATNAFVTYLTTNGPTTENRNFAIWGISYLIGNPISFNQAFIDLLNGVYNENSPIYIPDNFDVIYGQEWYDDENELGIIDIEMVQQGVPNDPIPEAYYIKNMGIDMTPATPRNGTTVHGNPRNAKYFWDQLIKKRPEMFSADNRAFIKNNDFKSIKVDYQWIKYNPTHKSYLYNQLVHHHHKQRNMAFAIPQKVHQKWTSILHRARINGRLANLGGRLNSLGPFLELFSIVTDIRTGNPDAFVNGFGSHDEIGKLYKEPIQNFYFEITEQSIFKNSSGTITRAIVTYDAFEDYIWDEDERRYMGVFKIATYVEDIDVINHRTNSLTKKQIF
ncbi:hypothetical protein [Pedobacter borealis]|uniref:hypothetical protein n=1 Tax=Pedobacter borealis TaxID=475254 RepID=UPI00049322C9|nr:hypothetical protein [Pedobacter borealis]